MQNAIDFQMKQMQNQVILLQTENKQLRLIAENLKKQLDAKVGFYSNRMNIATAVIQGQAARGEINVDLAVQSADSLIERLTVDASKAISAKSSESNKG